MLRQIACLMHLRQTTSYFRGLSLDRAGVPSGRVLGHLHPTVAAVPQKCSGWGGDGVQGAHEGAPRRRSWLAYFTKNVGAMSHRAVTASRRRWSGRRGLGAGSVQPTLHQGGGSLVSAACGVVIHAETPQRCGSQNAQAGVGPPAIGGHRTDPELIAYDRDEKRACLVLWAHESLLLHSLDLAGAPARARRCHGACRLVQLAVLV